jgi:hypothetical protein
MKALLALLLGVNLAAGAWLWLGGPIDMVREPGRLQLQVLPELFQPLTDAEVAGQRSQAAEKEKAAAAAASAAAAAAVPAPIDLPMADCVWILNLSNDAAARKLRSRIAEAGLGGRVSLIADPETQKLRLRISGLDASDEDQLHQLLKESPKLVLEHCIGGVAH